MEDFLRFFNDKRTVFPMHLEISYNKTCDWMIVIYKKGCADDYPYAQHDGDDVVVCHVQNIDMELCFAMAHVALKEWLLEFEEGY